MSESNPLLSHLVDATEAPADGTKEEKVDFVTAIDRKSVV